MLAYATIPACRISIFGSAKSGVVMSTAVGRREMSFAFASAAVEASWIVARSLSAESRWLYDLSKEGRLLMAMMSIGDGVVDDIVGVKVVNADRLRGIQNLNKIKDNFIIINNKYFII